ncbi:MAG TPA: CHASE3 domain-containing protein [Saprospiraceae bacterium]|nr:CHASE3 domain-containing protein [Saprospiraceae bacterium]
MLVLTRPEKKILIAVLSILIALCSLAYLAYRNSQRLLNSAEAIEQAEEIKYHILQVQSTLTDMETGVRGYVMTGDETYMVPANAAIADIFLHIHQLNSFPGISAEQSDQMTRLQSLVDEKSTYTNRVAELRRQKGMNEAIAFISEGKEKMLMDQIRDITGNLQRDTDARLTELKAENKNVITHFAVTFYLLLLKVSVTVVTIIFLFIFYFHRRNKAEKVLKESQQLFQNVMDHSSSLISIKDLSGRYMLINQAYENLLGTTKEKVKGKTAYDLFERSAADAIRDNDLEVIRLQQQIKSEEVIGNGNAMQHFVSLKFPLFDIHHIPYAVCSISTDETERAKTEVQHQEQMKRILDLFNNAPCGYQATDKNGIIIEMNETLLKWLGYQRHEVVGKMHVKSLVSEESLKQYAYYFPRIRSGEIKSIFDLEGSYVRKDGSKFSVIANSIAQYDDEDNFLYTRTSIFDISYRRRVSEVAVNN